MRSRILANNQPIKQTAAQSLHQSPQCSVGHSLHASYRSTNHSISQPSLHHCTKNSGKRHRHGCLFSHRSIKQSNNQTDLHSVNFSTLLHIDSTKQRSSVLDPSLVNQSVNLSTNQSIIQSINPTLSSQNGYQNDNESNNHTINQHRSNAQSLQPPVNQPNHSAVRQFPECPPHLNPANLPKEPAIIAPISFYRARLLNPSIDQPLHQTVNQTAINELSLDQSTKASSVPAIKRVLIYKKVTTLEEIRRGVKNPVDFPYLRADAKVLLADREHSHTLSTVRQSLTVLGLEWREVESINDSDLEWCDLLMCVGGDGTFLKAQRAVGDGSIVGDAANNRSQPSSQTINRTVKPMVGVNSAPSSSFGFFCAADHASISQLMSRLIVGSALLCPLWRMRVRVNNQSVGPLILNEMLFCNPIPSGTTRYWLTNQSINQQQQSSGCWISTAAGSTGAIHGAGGELMNLSDSRFQYRIRELFSLPLTHPRELPINQSNSATQPNHQTNNLSTNQTNEFPHLSFHPRPSTSRQVLASGYLSNDFSLVSRMMSGCLYFDGSNQGYPVNFNDTITIERSSSPLLWVAPTVMNEGKTVADHWELVTGLQRAKLPPRQAQWQIEMAKQYGFEQYNV